jgi:putative transposase
MTTPIRKPYLTDLTDDQWHILQPLIPPAKPGGRPRAVDMREIINTILYLNRTGCQWDMLPHDLLPRSTVYEWPRSRRRPLSATQHNPTTSLVGISFHCHET